ncbi:MAG: ABC transporter ATP-binding protein [Bacilli bacterium]|nr:ABC transporter ATP-binding protein [Bacilli bacterium]
MKNIIEINKVSLCYQNNKVISNMSINIEKGDYVAIIGENGTGKSTLIKSILGLKKVDEGKIKFNYLKRNEVGYLPQKNTSQKDFPASVFEIVLSGRLNNLGFKPFYTKKDKEIVIENLKKLDILKYKDKSFNELSGGEQQRVLLARSLSSSKELLILDEPVTGLDKKTTEDLYKIIKELNIKDKMTIVMVSHDLESAFEYANKILELKKEEYTYKKVEEYIHEDNCDFCEEEFDD